MRKKKYAPAKTSKAVNKLAVRAVSYAMVSEVYHFVLSKDNALDTENLAKRLDKLAIKADLAECAVTISDMFFGKNYEDDVRDIIAKYLPEVYTDYSNDDYDDGSEETYEA